MKIELDTKKIVQASIITLKNYHILFLILIFVILNCCVVYVTKEPTMIYIWLIIFVVSFIFLLFKTYNVLNNKNESTVKNIKAKFEGEK